MKFYIGLALLALADCGIYWHRESRLQGVYAFSEYIEMRNLAEEMNKESPPDIDFIPPPYKKGRDTDCESEVFKYHESASLPDNHEAISATYCQCISVNAGEDALFGDQLTRIQIGLAAIKFCEKTILNQKMK